MGAWIETAETEDSWTAYQVAPFMGAWIETVRSHSWKPVSVSLPSWERGLKPLNTGNGERNNIVAPFMGAWIETLWTSGPWWCRTRSLPSWERGLKQWNHLRSARWDESLPSWERGLKPFSIKMCSSLISRSLHGSVDWNLVGVAPGLDPARSLPSWERGLKLLMWVFMKVGYLVAPFMGAWIETYTEKGKELYKLGRSLHGSVDWNPKVTVVVFDEYSRSLHGSVDWNMEIVAGLYVAFPSLPSWERGLKRRWIPLK